MTAIRKSESLKLVEAREAYGRSAWAEAHRRLRAADEESPLEAEDLERLALAAYMIGRDDEYLETLERAHEAHKRAGRCARAVRCAFWIGFRWLLRGEQGRATGWIARAERLLAAEASECAEQGYLLLATVQQRLACGDLDAALAAASDAAAIGERCDDADLIACARFDLGQIRLLQGEVQTGLALLDETMLSVSSGQLSPLVTGLMYCAVIAACQQVYAIERSREWTSALWEWCERQPDMVSFVGTCQVHRAEVLQLQGAWEDAIEAARSAGARADGVSRAAAAEALYQLGELHRLRGETAAAEGAYRDASRLGLEPQPGLALLRLAQGRAEPAAAAIRRAAGATTSRLGRMRLLPACVEIMLAVGAVDEARQACEELEEIARTFDTGAPGAIAAQARGAVEAAAGDAQAALGPLRRAFETWRRIDAPYAAARTRELIGLACRALGDEDGADLELEAARSAYERLGAAPDLTRISALMRGSRSGATHGLTPRELEVLRLVAGGETNKAIAARLSLSEKTVDRHVSNIFTKLDVSSRAAATAYAYRHNLV